MKLLITGFEPFGGDAVNPSWEAVQALPEQIGQYQLHKLRLPVVFGKAAEMAVAEAERLQADAVLAIGLAGGRRAVTPEVVAINLRDAGIPDNAGLQPHDEPIAPGAPAAYFATLPVRAMKDAIRAADIPAMLSYSAGVYVCNDLMYSLLHHFAGTQVRCGFMHVPYLPDMGTPSLPLEKITAAVKAAVETL
ncbi:MAG: pyroglutamyl-peptidase I [Clostridia bacterium]|nr:pyroglutamyl-peptidase I [Clostridia bacterium]MBR5382819.1 pyroglutamyl-peptidase I [Clostridia bacterium]